jgi:hypothetical protein
LIFPLSTEFLQRDAAVLESIASLSILLLDPTMMTAGEPVTKAIT